MVRAKKLVRITLWSLIMLTFPVGYVVVQAAGGNAAVKAFLADPGAFFAARSPGQRGAMPFATTKPAYARPHAPAASKPDPGLSPPDSEASLDPPVTIPDIALDPSPFLAGPSGFQVAAPIDSFTYPGERFFPVFAPVPGPRDGSTSPLPLPPSVPVPVPPPPPGQDPQATVPEPGTWLMMIVGFLATGSVLRRRQARVASKA